VFAPQPYCIGENATMTLSPRRSGVNSKFIKLSGSAAMPTPKPQPGHFIVCGAIHFPF
jgi:hypothetical protein